jgi:hypothetical protein
MKDFLSAEVDREVERSRRALEQVPVSHPRGHALCGRCSSRVTIEHWELSIGQISGLIPEHILLSYFCVGPKGRFAAVDE